MPRTTEEILAHADELARQAEEYEPKPGDRDRVPPEVRLRLAALKRAEAEAEVAGLYRDYKGERYWFCCASCAPLFDADPERYAYAS